MQGNEVPENARVRFMEIENGSGAVSGEWIRVMQRQKSQSKGVAKQSNSYRAHLENLAGIDAHTLLLVYLFD